MTITDIANAVAPEAEQKIIGIRPGEKLHEQMIGVEDAPHTFEYDEHLKYYRLFTIGRKTLNVLKTGKECQRISCTVPITTKCG